MARRRRRIPRKKTSRWLIAAQVITLLGVLIFILLFRDLIASGAGQVFGTLGPSDVQVQKPDDQQKSSPPALETPDATSSPDSSSAH